MSAISVKTQILCSMGNIHQLYITFFVIYIDHKKELIQGTLGLSSVTFSQEKQKMKSENI